MAESSKSKSRVKSSGTGSISLIDAYKAISETFHSNAGQLEGRDDEYSQISTELIEALPHPSAATELEMRAVMQEVIAGRLEWGYSLSDGRHTMSEYATAASEPYGGWQVHDEELAVLKASSSRLWPFLSPGITSYRILQAQRHLERFDTKAAEDALQRGLSEARERKDFKGVADIEFFLEEILTKTGRESEAISRLEGFLSESQNASDVYSQGRALYDLGYLYKKMGDPGRATEYLKAALSLMSNENLEDQIPAQPKVRLLEGLAGMLREEGDEEGARSLEVQIENTLQRAMETSRKNKDVDSLIEILFSFSDMLLIAEREKEAVAPLEEALSLSRSTSNVLREEKALNRLGTLHQRIGDLAKAEKYLRSAISLTSNEGLDERESLESRRMSMDALAVVLREKGDVEEAASLEVAIEELNQKMQQFPASDLNAEIDGLQQQATEVRHPESVVSTLLATPSPKIVSDHWSQSDALGYESYARAIASLITHEETLPPLTIGIKAQWGAGKTTMMKMVQYMLDGDARYTEKNNAQFSFRRSVSEISLSELLEMLASPPDATWVTPMQSEKGKQYNIPPRVTVWFNAWKYQTSEQIWAGLAHCIISQVTARMDARDREKFWLRLHAKRVDAAKIRRQTYLDLLREFLPKGIFYGVGVVAAVAVSLVITQWPDVASYIPTTIGGAGSILAMGTGIAHFLREKSDRFREKVTGDLRKYIREPDYEGRLGFLHLVESDIRDVLDLVANEQQPLVIFIDDLDRCAPSKVAEVVEAINLFISGDLPNCIFVLGLEPGIVAAAMEVANKDLLEKADEFALVESTVPVGWRFMEKIIQLPLSVPHPTPAGEQTYIGSLLGITATPVTKDEAAVVVEPPAEPEVRKYLKKFEEANNIAEVEETTRQLFRDVTLQQRPAVVEATKRSYSRKFTDRDPAIQQFIQAATTEFGANPRRIKRYLNLFRFLATVRHTVSWDYSLTHDGEHPDMPPDEVLTKYVVMCIEWPQATACMCMKVQPGEDTAEMVSLVNCLEEKARALATRGDDKEADKEWAQFLKGVGLNFGQWGKSDRFRQFLATGRPLAGYQESGLW